MLSSVDSLFDGYELSPWIIIFVKLFLVIIVLAIIIAGSAAVIVSVILGLVYLFRQDGFKEKHIRLQTDEDNAAAIRRFIDGEEENVKTK